MTPMTPMTPMTVGLDLAKNVFHVHVADASGRMLESKKLVRRHVLDFFMALPSCLVGLEACATAHYWARQLRDLGHDVRLIPPGYVKPFVRRGAKNDATDAAAICEAVTRPGMRFVPIKSRQGQAFLMLHRARALLIRQRTMAACAFRAHLAEYGIVVAQGRHRVEVLTEQLDELREDLPEDACFALDALVEQLDALNRQIAVIDARLAERHKTDAIFRLLATIPGIGPITATAFTATIPDPSAFRLGREFAAWLGLSPRQNSSGGKHRLGGITKKGDRYLRHLLVLGARTVVRYPKARSRVDGPWIEGLLARRRPMVVAVAVANKLARTIWAMLSTGEVFRPAQL
ncbi:transposase [Tranquillimonas alkanivorans]|uniref:Transposase n=2 Tax=Tranquillimonas alkanivorans TaxID=441119 RepID=A0A1I5W4W8_9RHOB|nr:transposase [Tranquillimonas alkanivorans]